MMHMYKYTGAGDLEVYAELLTNLGFYASPRTVDGSVYLMTDKVIEAEDFYCVASW